MPNTLKPHSVKPTAPEQFSVEDVVTVSVKLAEVVIGVGVSESATFSVKVKVPVAVGVPEMVALDAPEVSVRPAGKLDPVATLHV
jgi:hypothetical protein